jgi:membrane fusion protein (multidrug efflux system)
MMPPPAVGIVTVHPERVDEVAEFAGQIEAVRRVEVRSPVAGVIVAQPIREGAEVKAGDVLFRIDPTTADAALRGAKARLSEAEARLLNASRTLARLRPLLSEHAVAQRDVDDAEAAEAQARASVEDAHASVDRASKDLNDATIRAEIGGRVGKANLVLGARVTGPAELLTTIDALDPVRVTFRPSSQQILQWRRDPKSLAALRPGGAARIRVILPDGSLSPVAGKLDFVDPVIDPASGTQEFRAEIPNQSRLLLPGQFVRVRLEGLVRESAILVPQRAVQQALGRQSVFVLGVGDTVAIRDVKATAWVGDRWLIEDGLAAGDRVIVEGSQKVRPGTVAKPTPAAANGGEAKPAGGTK